MSGKWQPRCLRGRCSLQQPPPKPRKQPLPAYRLERHTDHPFDREHELFRNDRPALEGGQL
jgi:hypothetical protein